MPPSHSGPETGLHSGHSAPQPAGTRLIEQRLCLPPCGLTGSGGLSPRAQESPLHTRGDRGLTPTGNFHTVTPSGPAPPTQGLCLKGTNCEGHAGEGSRRVGDKRAGGDSGTWRAPAQAQGPPRNVRPELPHRPVFPEKRELPKPAQPAGPEKAEPPDATCSFTHEAERGLQPQKGTILSLGGVGGAAQGRPGHLGKRLGLGQCHLSAAEMALEALGAFWLLPSSGCQCQSCLSGAK